MEHFNVHVECVSSVIVIAFLLKIYIKKMTMGYNAENDWDNNAENYYGI